MIDKRDSGHNRDWNATPRQATGRSAADYGHTQIERGFWDMRSFGFACFMVVMVFGGIAMMRGF